MFYPIDSLISNISGNRIPQIVKWGINIAKNPKEDNGRTKGREGMRKVDGKERKR